MIAIDMPMPKRCSDCLFVNLDYKTCWALPDRVTPDDASLIGYLDNDKKRPHCPLIEVTHATDEILVDERLIENISPGELLEGVREIHASRMGKVIFDHPEVMKTEYENYGNGSQRYRANCYMVNVNQEAKDGKADNQ